MPIVHGSNGRFVGSGSKWKSLGDTRGKSGLEGRLVKVARGTRGAGLRGRITGTSATSGFVTVRSGSGRVRSYHSSQLLKRSR